ncbi:Golgi integral membrane protein 4 [Microcaecilia unicolor]|uniref:Golgi integral membrane protein 4-like n=1 Tax=Microcaecilia unicolor TaxID=1415580 RepID=A0A6P7ZXC4_9AMPH|nr:Golgi integral membrane protein 4-like [Microcaecilia unicolor]
MGSTMCLRRQKGLMQTAFCLLVLLCLGSGLFFYAHLQQKVKNSESLVLKYKQQQEALSGQLQVVYEHRSRLERSLQKERGEHKKTKEDFLVYKLEAQEALNKEKQDAMNRYGALSSQHKILKNQHDDVKKQLLDMQVQHNSLKLEHSKTVEGHSQKYSLMQREKENDVASLQGAVSRLREENKLLRKAHQEVHLQLHKAQAQVEEFRQLKEALQRIPSFKMAGAVQGHIQQQFGGAENKISRASSPGAAPNPGQENPGIYPLVQQPQSDHGTRLQGGSVFRPQAQPRDANQHPVSPSWLKKEQSESHVGRLMRTMNSLQDGNLAQRLPPVLGDENKVENKPPAQEISTQVLLSVTPKPQQTGAKQVHSWQDIVNKASIRMREEQLHEPPQGDPDHKREQRMPPAEQGRETQAEAAQDRANVENLDFGTERLEREEHLYFTREPATQEPVLAAAADPAQDPNNQGEDEFEEAELERPDFEEKLGGADKIQKLLKEGENKEAKDAAVADKAGEGPVEYEEDQQQENEDHDGEIDDTEDLELIQGKEEPGDNPEKKHSKEEYY